MKPQFLTQLAIAGIAAGYLSTAAFAEDKPVPAKKDAAMSAPAVGDTAAQGKAMGSDGKAAKHDCKGHSECKGMGGCKATGKEAKAADSEGKAAKHSCKGHNECKGMGGCKMSEKDIKAAAKKHGVAAEKIGKAHDCKGKNECKGLGGCKS